MNFFIQTITIPLLVGVCITCHAQRNPFQWPFSSNSIWNMPIGSNAVYVDAEIDTEVNRGLTVDEDIIVFTPKESSIPVYTSNALWNRDRDRCEIDGPLLFEAPIPKDFIVSSDTWDGLTPNSGLAVLMPDARTIVQTQPFAKCTEDNGTSRYVPAEVDLYGEGITGAHGGSGLSAVGGTLRLGELDDENDTIKHALKVNLFANENLFYDEETKGFRWPALRADSYAADQYYTERVGPIVKACRMGALLAIPTSISLEGLNLETIPALILARAFQQYGAYIVDDTAWDVYAIVTEWSPSGRFTDEFEKAWGFPFDEGNKDTPWSRDIKKIFDHLHVVDNNEPDNIGGGGEPLAPLAPPLTIVAPGPEPTPEPTPVDSVRLKVATFLEGYLNADQTSMSLELNKNGLIPSVQPFSSTPFNYQGDEQAGTIPPNVVDWILVELRDGGDQNVVIQQIAAYLASDGRLYDVDGKEGVLFSDLKEAEYYVVLKARAHLAIISSTPIIIKENMDTIEFYTDPSTAAGNEQLILRGEKYVQIAGDFDGNGIINNQDINLWSRNSATLNQYLSVDADANGIINNKDFNLWAGNRSKIGEVK